MSKYRVAVVVAAVVLLTACGKDDAEPPVAASATVSPAAVTPDASAGIAGPDPVPSGRPEITRNPDGTVNSGGPRPATTESALTAGGLGPYAIGVAQRELAAAGLVRGGVKETSGNCPGYGTATGAARHHSPALVFYRGRLLRLAVTSGAVGTDTGVRIGMPLAEVKKRYPGGQQIDDWTGRAAWLTTTGDYGLLFETQDGKVSVMQAGMVEPMRFKYTDNQGC